MHLEGASTSPLAALAALQVLQVACCSSRSMMGSSTSAASPAYHTSLHGSNPLSLMFSSFQLRCGGVAAELELSCSILSTRKSDLLGVYKGARRGWLGSSDSRH